MRLDTGAVFEAHVRLPGADGATAALAEAQSDVAAGSTAAAAAVAAAVDAEAFGAEWDAFASGCERLALWCAAALSPLPHLHSQSRSPRRLWADTHSILPNILYPAPTVCPFSPPHRNLRGVEPLVLRAAQSLSQPAGAPPAEAQARAAGAGAGPLPSMFPSLAPFGNFADEISGVMHLKAEYARLLGRRSPGNNKQKPGARSGGNPRRVEPARALPPSQGRSAWSDGPPACLTTRARACVSPGDDWR